MLFYSRNLVSGNIWAVSGDVSCATSGPKMAARKKMLASWTGKCMLVVMETEEMADLIRYPHQLSEAALDPVKVTSLYHWMLGLVYHCRGHIRHDVDYETAEPQDIGIETFSTDTLERYPAL